MTVVPLPYVHRSEVMVAVETPIRVPAEAAAKVRAEKAAEAGAAVEAQASGQHGMMSNEGQTCSCCSLLRRVGAGEIGGDHEHSSSPADQC